MAEPPESFERKNRTMKFTGERCVLGKSIGLLEKEHLARYEFALKYAHGKKVLDIGCGTGYGLDLIACKASEVIGIDISQEAIDYAIKHYKKKNTGFYVADAVNLNFLKEQEFDLIVSLEVIEHIRNCHQYLKEVHRLLRCNGVFILSTPNKKYHSPHSEKPVNPFHVTEFWLNDFRELLKRDFGNVKLYGQYHQSRFKKIVKKLLPQKVWKMALQTIGDVYRSRQASSFSDKNVENYSYFVAVCKK